MSQRRPSLLRNSPNKSQQLSLNQSKLNRLYLKKYGPLSQLRRKSKTRQNPKPNPHNNNNSHKKLKNLRWQKRKKISMMRA